MLCAIPGSSDHGATRLRLLPIKGGRHVTNRETDGGETGANSSAVLPEKLCFRICRLPLHIATNPPFRDCQFYRTKCVIVHGGGISLNEESGPESSAWWPAREASRGRAGT